MPGHTYSEGVIRLFLQLVLVAPCSLRAASAAMRLLGCVFPGLPRTPVANTGQMWLLRIGLHELTRPKQPADDWAWIVDHTIQIGTVKCLVIAGCRLSVWQRQQRALEHRDLEIFALEPVEKSDGPTVCRQLRTTCEQSGIVPRLILSDEGTDLRRGIAAFCVEHPQTTASLDIAHQAAKLLKRELENDARWARFLSQAGESKKRLVQTPLAHLLPPTPREKARYMNLEELVAWGRKALCYLEQAEPGGPRVDPDLLQARLGWLPDFREALAEWSLVMQTIGAARDCVRQEGYHAGAARLLRARLVPLARSSMSRRLAARLIRFVRAQSVAATGDERLIGSSECLESLIGKGKRLEGQQSRSGFTAMLLGLAAAVVEPTHEFLQTALTTIQTRHVTRWCHERLGPSLQARRRQAFAATGTKTG